MDERDRPGNPRTAAAKPAAGGRDWSADRMAAPSSTVPGSPAPGGGDFSLPAISLPTGGGAIRGIDEKLTVGQATGTASLLVPRVHLTGRAGLGPKLSPELRLRPAATALTGSAGACRCRRSPARPSKGLPRYDDAADSDVLRSSPAPRIWSRCSSQAGRDWVAGRVDGRRVGTSSLHRDGPTGPRVESGLRPHRALAGSTAPATVALADDLQGRTSRASTARTETSRIADPADPRACSAGCSTSASTTAATRSATQYKAEDTSRRARGPRASSAARSAPTATSSAIATATTPRTCPRRRARALRHSGASSSCSTTASTTSSRPTARRSRSPWPCRPDPFSTYRSGFEVRTYRPCRRRPDVPQLPGARRGTRAGPLDRPRLPQRTRPGRPDAAGATRCSPRSRRPGGSPSRAGGGYETDAAAAAASSATARWRSTNASTQADPLSLQNLTGDFDGARERWVDLDGRGTARESSPRTTAAGTTSATSAPGTRAAVPRSRALRAACTLVARQAGPSARADALDADRPQRRREPVRGELRPAGARLVRVRRRQRLGAVPGARRRPRRASTGRAPTCASSTSTATASPTC